MFAMPKYATGRRVNETTLSRLWRAKARFDECKSRPRLHQYFQKKHWTISDFVFESNL